MKTLLVEDDVTTQKYLVEVLTSLGHEVVAYSTAEEALQAFRPEEYDMVVVDWLMPMGEVDGLDLCRAVRQRTNGTGPFIMVVTVKNRPEDLDAVLDAGADDYLSKPVRPNELRTRLRIARERIRDQSARSAAEFQLDASKLRMEKLVSNAPIILFIVNRHGVFTYAEGRGLATLGLSPAEVVGQSMFDLFHGVPDVAAQVSRALSGEEFTIELEMQNVAFEAWHAPLEAEQGAVMVWTDVTRRRLVEAELRQGDLRFRRFAEAAFEGIVVIDSGRVVDANQQIAHVFGVDPKQIIGERVARFVVKHDHRRGFGFLQTLRAEPFELQARRPDGRIIQVEVRIRPLSSSRGDLVVAAVQDVTSKKRAEEERRRLEERVRHAQKLESLGVLAGGIAHDFNNLLMGVLGNASLALLDLPKPSPAADYIKLVEQSAQRAGDLTNQMLAFAGKGKFLVTRINLSEFTEECRSTIESLVSSDTTVEYHLDPDVPPIDADETQIRQVVTNLVSNASEAMEGMDRGHIALTTGVRHASRQSVGKVYTVGDIEDGYYVYLEVKDTGTGMDKETTARVFDPFFTTKFTGRGLGMAAVSGIVRSHRGAIRIQTTPSHGTTVTVLLPPAQTSDADLAGPVPSPTAPAVSKNAVLLVDDEETVRVVTGKMLERMGYDVLVAESGKTALSLFKAHVTDITAVLLDLTMPDMTGHQVFDELQQLRPDVRVVLMSGYDEQAATRDFGVRRLAGFLQKPFSTQDLEGKLADSKHRVQQPDLEDTD